MNIVSIRNISKKLVAIILIALVIATATPQLSAITLAQSTQSTQEQIPYYGTVIPLWSVSGYEFAWFLSDDYVLLGQGYSAQPREGVYFNKRIGIVAYSFSVEIRDAKTGNVVWSDSPPSNTIRVARVVDGGARLEKIVDIPFTFNEPDHHHIPLPQGILVADSGILYLYDYSGNLIKTLDTSPITGKSNVDCVFATLDGSLIVYQVTGYDNVVMIFLDSSLNIIAELIPADKNVPGDSDPETVTITDYYIVTADNWQNVLYIIDRNTFEWTWYAGSTSAYYVATAATLDGKYVFALKSDGTLEVWKWNGGLNLTLIETISTPLSISTDITFPRGAVETAISELYPILVFPTAIISYYPETETYKIDVVSTTGHLASISSGAKYAMMGSTMFMFVRQDVQATKPRVRFWGHMVFERGMQDLGTAITFEAPQRDWHLYFYSGRVTISKIYTESIPVTLTDDPDILQGKLGKLYNRGLVSAIKVVESSGSVDRLELETVDVPEAGFTAEHTVAMSSLFNIKALYGWNGHGFGGATVSSATVIDIPFSAPMDAYSEVKLQQAISIVTVAPIFDWKQELLGVFGLEFVSGGVSFAAGKALATKAAQIAVEKAVLWGIAKSGATISLDTLEAALRGAKAATKIGSKILSIVGIALIVDAGLGIYSHYVTYSSVRSFVMIMPIVEDPYGNKYSAVVLILPMEEIQNYAGEYESHIRSIAQQYGIKDVGIQFIVWGKNWDEYRTLLEAGSLPTIDLKSAIETTIAAKYGYSLGELKITGAKIVVETLVHGWTNLWDWVWGGLKVPVVTLVAGASIQPKAVTAGGKIYDDPSIIADILGKVTINGKTYKLSVGGNGAYVDFQLPLGADKLVIDFGKRLGYFADIRIDVDVLVKKEMQPLGDFAYTATLHYDWEDTLIRIEKIEFTDMPYPMVKAERTFIYKYGNFTNDITNAFELSEAVEDPSSPSGYYYYYVTTENTKFIDPANGGIMQPCKTYVFAYF